MVLFENIFFLLSGFVLLILSGDKLVDTSVTIARRWKIPASVIAVTIIAAGTSAPELVTSFLAGFKGNSDISIGNVIGSNTFNILAVGGLSLMLQPFGKVSGTFISWIVLLAATGLLFFCSQDFELSNTEGAFFIVALVLFIILSFFQNKEDVSTFENIDSRSRARTIVFFCLSLLGLIGGAELALTGGVKLGQMAGLSDRVIAITIISVGTGLPELATSIAAAIRGHSDIAIANIIGSNIFNTLAIPGLTASVFPLIIDEQFLNFDFYAMTSATVAVGTVYLIKNHSLRRTLGFLMFVGYCAYTFKLVFTL